MDTGDNSGTWGTVTNTNLELIGEAFGFGTEAITTNADTHTSTIADGSTDPVRAMYVKYTGTLDSTCTITIGPNTVNKFYYIENGTSGSQDIVISQGSGANVTIPAGDVKAVYLDGAGSGAAVTDAFASLNVGAFTSNGSSTITVDDNSTILNLVSTDADANTGPRLDLTRNSASPAANDILGQIRFMGEDAADNSISYVSMFSQLLDPTDGGEDGSFELDVRLAGSNRSRMITNATETVFNDDGQDINFRIETDAQASAFVIDAADDTIKMTNQVVTITHGGNGKQLELVSTDADASSGPQLDLYRNSASPADNDLTGRIVFAAENEADEKIEYSKIITWCPDVSDGSEDGAMQFYVMKDGSSIQRLEHSSTETVFNQDSADINFRVESNGNANMLFVDGGNDAVIVGANDADTTISGGTPAFQVIGTGIGASVASTRRENNQYGAALIMAKSRNTTPDSFTVVQAGDTLGSVIFIGDDGTNLDTYGATISSVVKSGVGANDMPAELIFSTNSGTTSVAERMKIQHNSGENVVIADGLKLTDGNLIIGGAGHGIDFSATSDTGGMQTEILDDYEEGTFTPTQNYQNATNNSAASVNAAAGRYTKIGNVVHFTIRMNVEVPSSLATDNFSIQSLPFTSENVTSVDYVYSSFLNSKSSVTNPILFMHQPNQAVAFMTDLQGTGNGGPLMGGAGSGTSELNLTGTYRTA